MRLSSAVSKFDPCKATCSFTYVHKPTDQGIVVIRGPVDGDGLPEFQISDQFYQREYRSCFGPMFYIEGLEMPGSGPGEFKAGVSRLFAIREPDVAGLHDRLKRNQDTMHRRFRGLLHRFKKHIHLYMNSIVRGEGYPVWLDRACAKRKIRLNVHADDLKYLNLLEDEMKMIRYFLKSSEWLSLGKKRAVGDLGSKRTQQTAWFCEFVKEAWSVPFVLDRAEFRFLKAPEKDELREGMNRLMNVGLGEMYFLYFSDDSCVSVGCLDGVFTANLDIKQCDGSHYNPLFRLFEYLLCTDCAGLSTFFSEDLKRALSYLRRPCVVSNPEDWKVRVVYIFLVMRLFSGSVLTTLLNNLANLLIGLSIYQLIGGRLLTKNEVRELLVPAGEAVGYIIKIVECNHPEDIQFLKHSPHLNDEGSYEPIINLAVFFRGFGTFVGELPGSGKKSYARRAQDYINDVIIGRRNWGNHAINDAFQSLVTSDVKCSLANRIEHVKSIGDCFGRVSLSSIATRYDCHVSELEELCNCIRESGVGSIVNLEVVTKMYRKDYG